MAKEIDDFLPRYVTPVLSARGFRKSGHTYRKRFESGDWSIFSFRGYPLGIRGSFLAEADAHPAMRLRGWSEHYGARPSPA